MQIRPENGAIDAPSGLKHVMVVVPINADVNEAEDVAEENGQLRFERRQAGSFGNFQLEHHNCNDDGDDAVAEGFKPILFHERGYARRVKTLNCKCAHSCGLSTTLDFV